MNYTVNGAGFTVADIYFQTETFYMPEHWCVQLQDPDSGSFETHMVVGTWEDANKFAESYGITGELMWVKL
jgi:hypothetical protein